MGGISEDAGESADPLAEGFRNPPDRVTEPCLTYMARIMELRDFVGFYFNFVKTSVALGKLVPEDEQSRADARGREVLRYDYSRHRFFVNEIMLSRAIESFDLYLTTVLRDIFLARPEILKSEGSIDIAAIIEAGSYDDLIWRVAERFMLYGAFGLDHRVPKSGVRAQARRSWRGELVELEWARPKDGRMIKLELRLKQPEAFLAALRA